MRLRRLLRRIRRGDSKGDEPVLGLLPQLVEQIVTPGTLPPIPSLRV